MYKKIFFKNKTCENNKKKFMGFSLYTIYEFGKLMWDSL